MTVIIHTPAPIEELTKIVGERGNVTAGTALNGQPDCFAGWFEPADTFGSCVPNNLVETTMLEHGRAIAQEIFDAGYQVVVTVGDAVGDQIIRDKDMPYRYTMEHAH